MELSRIELSQWIISYHRYGSMNCFVNQSPRCSISEVVVIIPNQPHLAQSRAWHIIGASLEPHVDITNFQRIGANRLLGTRALTFSSPNLGFTSFMILSNAEHALMGPIKLFNGHASSLWNLHLCQLHFCNPNPDESPLTKQLH